MNTIGQKIKFFRKRLSLTQDEFADKYGFSLGQIKHWETDRHQPDVESIKALCVIFGVSSDALLGFDDERNDSLLDLLLSDVKRDYNKLNGSEQGKYAKHIAVYSKMLLQNKDLL
ncbi:helix-turn-helix domain-containing protein [Bacillus mycoides]|uniref:helix-turn-helix domain-containing protein n=1 Tax=Bacillus mycoides TaxID=1405 RepID=UPI000BF77505|nr:helix-turn-helix transcriptional regulator [Bacillus mycoides]MED1010718.1 helix-turn-helix transcriptional regulator [Bacillus mycoides]MED1054258.1 helix-turn-helix transcriptional regulator [Bacillus mycoides]PER27230.1 transcriptional regulator [Bacillus cereus]